MEDLNVLALIRVAHQCRESIAMLPWQRFRYLLHYWQWRVSVQKERIAAFPLLQWLRERATMLRGTYIFYLLGAEKLDVLTQW